MFIIEEELKKAPEKPGVYIMKDINGKILYIGKARILKNRLKQYFLKYKYESIKTKALVSKVSSFEYIVSDSESEALVLERNMIHKIKPPYNILLKDDKSFPYIKVTINEMYPRVFLTRKRLSDGSKYFGPYTDYLSAKETVQLINKIFPLKRCKKKFLNGYRTQRPCLNYYIDQCLGPCQGDINREDYDKTIDDIVGFINGRREKFIKEFQVKMQVASDKMDFEKAATYRDRIQSIEHITQKQKVFNMKSSDSDIIGLATDGITAVVNIFIIRGGITIGREFFILDNIKEDNEMEILSSFVNQYYDLIHFIPKNIIMPLIPSDSLILNEWLNDKKGQKVNFLIPKKGEKAEYINMANNNSELELLRINSDKMLMDMKTNKTLEEIKEELNLKSTPKRIEAFDISNNKNREIVASMVVYVNGKPLKRDYRRYKIKSLRYQNDYEAMQEVISRRFRKIDNEENNDENTKLSEFPDIILVDGGKGHVSSVINVLDFLKIDLPVFGMVKDNKHNSRGIITKDGEVDLKNNLVLYRFINGIQNEVHRFALEYNKKLREQNIKKSELDNINGIGEIRKRALLKEFKSIKSIKEASIEDLAKVKEISEDLAKRIYVYFN